MMLPLRLYSTMLLTWSVNRTLASASFRKWNLVYLTCVKGCTKAMSTLDYFHTINVGDVDIRSPSLFQTVHEKRHT